MNLMKWTLVLLLFGAIGKDYLRMQKRTYKLKPIVMFPIETRKLQPLVVKKRD